MAMVPLIRSIRVTIPVPVIACWANVTEPKTVRAATLAKTIFAILMEASRLLTHLNKPPWRYFVPAILHPSLARRTHHVRFQHRIHHVVGGCRDAELAAELGDLAAEPGHLEPVAAV